MLESLKIDRADSEGKPWIILINGLFASLHSWDQHIPYLTPFFNVARYNGPGQGDVQELDKAPTLSEQVSLLQDVLSSLDTEKVTLLGISNGARVALKFAELFPERIEKVLSFDTYHQLTPELEMKLESWLLASREGGNDLRFKVSTPWIFGASFLKERPEIVEFFKEHNRKKPAFIGEKLIESALTTKEKIQLDQIQTPIHFFVGDEDVLTPKDIHEQMTKEAQNSTLQVVKGGHASLLEYPESLSQIMETL